MQSTSSPSRSLLTPTSASACFPSTTTFCALNTGITVLLETVRQGIRWIFSRLSELPEMYSRISSGRIAAALSKSQIITGFPVNTSRTSQPVSQSPRREISVLFWVILTVQILLLCLSDRSFISFIRKYAPAVNETSAAIGMLKKQTPLLRSIPAGEKNVQIAVRMPPNKNPASRKKSSQTRKSLIFLLAVNDEHHCRTEQYFKRISEVKGKRGCENYK